MPVDKYGQKLSQYRDKLGPIPEDHFENDACAVNPEPAVVPPEDDAEMDAYLDEIKARLDAEAKPNKLAQPGDGK